MKPTGETSLSLNTAKGQFEPNENGSESEFFMFVVFSFMFLAFASTFGRCESVLK